MSSPAAAGGSGRRATDQTAQAWRASSLLRPLSDLELNGLTLGQDREPARLGAP